MDIVIIMRAFLFLISQHPPFHAVQIVACLFESTALVEPLEWTCLINELDIVVTNKMNNLLFILSGTKNFSRLIH